MMSSLEKKLLGAYEVHSVEEVREVLDAGLDLGIAIKGRSPVTWLTAMYTRSDRFAPCLELVLERGGELDDPKLEPVLLNDPQALDRALDEDPDLLEHRTSMLSAFTALEGASLLHVAAEFGHVEVTRVLLERGLPPDTRAATDGDGIGGHTPLFHTVNSYANRSTPVMRLLLDAGADPELGLAGVHWGQTFEWETTLFDVTPISYAQLGLLPQMHRPEEQVYETVRALLAAAGRPIPDLANIPNKYLQS